MARYELICGGRIKSYYDDFVDSYGYFECLGCKNGHRFLPQIPHSKDCPVVKECNKEKRQEQRRQKLRQQALKKLTKAEKRALDL
jgi:hypothetical protein